MSDQQAGKTHLQLTPSKLVDAYLRSPFSGIAPWIVMSLFTGPGTFEIAVCIALFLSLATFLLSRRGGGTFKLMEIFDLVFFAGFAIVGIVASASVVSWLELWAGEITNIALTLFVLITILIRQPFTLQYAKEATEEQYWKEPHFLRINYTISWVWAGAFAFQSLMGLIGDVVLDNSNNFWTGWILQIAALVFAVAFTEYWPDHAVAKLQGETGGSPRALYAWIPAYVLVTGVAGLITSSTTTIVGVVLIAVGLVGIFALKQTRPATKPIASNP